MVLTIKTYDGYTFKGRLSLPEGDGEISKLVIDIYGAGPNTYNDGFRIPTAPWMVTVMYRVRMIYQMELNRFLIQFIAYDSLSGMPGRISPPSSLMVFPVI
jgi:hypothetical protein